MLPALFAYAHHLAAFALVAALVIELVTLRAAFTLDSAQRLLNADRIYGIAAGAVLIIGALRVGFFEKTAAYYAHSVQAVTIAILAIGKNIGGEFFRRVTGGDDFVVKLGKHGSRSSGNRLQ